MICSALGACLALGGADAFPLHCDPDWTRLVVAVASDCVSVICRHARVWYFDVNRRCDIGRDVSVSCTRHSAVGEGPVTRDWGIFFRLPPPPPSISALLSGRDGFTRTERCGRSFTKRVIFFVFDPTGQEAIVGVLFFYAPYTARAYSSCPWSGRAVFCQGVVRRVSPDRCNMLGSRVVFLEMSSAPHTCRYDRRIMRCPVRQMLGKCPPLCNDRPLSPI